MKWKTKDKQHLMVLKNMHTMAIQQVSNEIRHDNDRTVARIIIIAASDQ